jgi:hypothetical protein
MRPEAPEACYPSHHENLCLPGVFFYIPFFFHTEFPGFPKERKNALSLSPEFYYLIRLKTFISGPDFHILAPTIHNASRTGYWIPGNELGNN